MSTTTVRMMPWSQGLAEYFTLAAADWQPPKVVQSWLNSARDRFTLRGVWRRPDGVTVTLTMRAQKGKDGEWFTAGQTADMRLVFEKDGRS